MTATTASACSHGRLRATKRQSTEERRSEGFLLFFLAGAAAWAGAAAAAEAAVGRSLFFFVQEKQRSRSSEEVERKASTQRVEIVIGLGVVSYLSLSLEALRFSQSYPAVALPKTSAEGMVLRFR